MPNLLHLDSSVDPTNSRSRAITRTFADAWRQCSPAHTVTYRDLHSAPLPHFPDPWLHWPARVRPAEAVVAPDAEALRDSLIAELCAADVVLIGAPMYNYSLPSTLKAWIDYIHIPGITALYDGNVQPMAGRPAVVVNSRGAMYDVGPPTEGWDHGTPVLDLILGSSLGMTMRNITANLTLADFVPMLADFIDRGNDEFAQAHAAAAALAVELGSA